MLAPSPEYLPTGQHTHVLAVEPTMLLFVPAGHVMQSAWPVAL